MRKITHYLVVAEKSAHVFEDVVCENIELGWQPYGSFQHIRWPHEYGAGYYEQYTQTMVKYEGDE